VEKQKSASFVRSKVQTPLDAGSAGLGSETGKK
jgi:hypothetical protein